MIKKILLNKKIYVLLIAGMPGLQKLLIFSFSNSFVDISALGEFSNDLHIIQFIALFTVIGWCGLLLIKLPKVKGEFSSLLSRIISNMLFYIVASFLLIYFLYIENYIYSLWSFILLVGWGGYQLLRHFYIAIRKYIELFYIDVGVTIIIMGAITSTFFNNLAIPVSLSYLFVFIVFVLYHKSIKINLTFIKHEHIQASEIGLTNILSSSILILLPPIFNYFLGEKYAALIGLIFALLSILLLLPRAMSKYYLPLMAKESLNIEKIKNLLKNFTIYNIIALFSIGILSYFLTVLLSKTIFQEMFLLDDSKRYFVYILLFVISSQLSLPISNLILALEKTRFLMLINFMYMICSFSFLTLISYICCEDGKIIILIFLNFIILLEIMRFFLLRKFITRFLKTEGVK